MFLVDGIKMQVTGLVEMVVLICYINRKWNLGSSKKIVARTSVSKSDCRI